MKRTLCIFLMLCSSDALAQTSPNDRMERLERDLQLIQKQLANQPAGAAIDGEPAASPATNARLGAQLSQIQEDLRKIHGQLEQMDHANKRNADALERLQKDSDLRFQDIEKKLHETKPAEATPVAQTPAEAAPATTEKPAEKSAEKPAEKPAAKPVIKVEDAKPEAAKEEPKKDEASSSSSASAPKNFESARDHYNYAFRLLNQTKYDEATQYFQSFTKAYPKDALIGNAYYWLGETFYIKRDYVKAADNFRQGFESLPNGPKAADNLLKLAMSLAALKRTEDACVVLKQVTTKFTNSSSVLIKKAEDEKVRLGCS